MEHLLNRLFYYLKFVLFITAFVGTLYVIYYMYLRLGKGILSMFPVFLPYLVLFILFLVNIFLHQKQVTHQMFYNITCSFVLGVITYVAGRAIFDTSMINRGLSTYHISFDYFANFVYAMKLMLYGLSIANLGFMFLRDPKDIKRPVLSLPEEKTLEK